MSLKKFALDEDSLLYLGELEPGVKPGSENIKCQEGYAAIEMSVEKEMFGCLYLPQDYARKTRPDVGRVIASGIEEIEPGEVVLVAYGHGKRVRGFSCKGFRAEGLMVFTGIAGGEMLDYEYGEANQPPIEIEWSETILAKYEQEWKPCGVQVFLRIPEVKETGGIALPGKRHACDAEIVAMGSTAFTNDRVSRPNVGATALFHDGALRHLGGDLYSTPSRMIYATYEV